MGFGVVLQTVWFDGSLIPYRLQASEGMGVEASKRRSVTAKKKKADFIVHLFYM